MNLLAVAWGLVIVVNVGWPRTEIYGITWYRRFSAPLATVAMLCESAQHMDVRELIERVR